MTRYFYNCPLKSAYMAKYFGIRFECDSASSFTYYFAHNAMLHDSTEKYYIHPDSLHLLEPVDGDFITFQGRLMQYYPDCEYNTDAFKKLLRESIKIIQRNGLAFMWPEEEPCT